MTSPNTKIRVLSALVLFMFMLLVLSLGKTAMMLSSFAMCLIVFDEIIKNFFKIIREDVQYWLYLAFFVFISVAFYQIKSFNIELWEKGVAITAVCAQVMLLPGLLFKSNWSKKFIYLNPWFWAVNISLVFLCFIEILNSNMWIQGLLFFVSISIICDSMAWVVGKKYGRTPLAPEISPNKTIEGAAGGWLCSAIVIYAYLSYQQNITFSWRVLLCAILLPLLSILGDLIQSYFKRIVYLKDSSQRIPGHGGFFDRLDSHFFLIPFYVFFTKMILS